MAYDPEMKDGGLKQAFQAAAGRGFAPGPVHEIAIPGNREPEISFLLDDIATVHTIYDALAAAGDVVIVPDSTRLNPGILVSLGQDTVDAEGYPTRAIENSGYTLRSRFTFETIGKGGRFSFFDKSVKSIEKNDSRKEWEAACPGIGDGYEGLLAANPTLPPVFQTLDPESFRVSGACLASRAIYSFLHVIDKDTAVLYDACNDACVMTTPYADAPVGYRREFEFEAKAVLGNPEKTDAAAVNAILDRSIASIRNIVAAATAGRGVETNESKLGHTQRVVREYYESTLGAVFDTSAQSHVRDGVDHALVQNIRPGDFMHLPQRENMVLLARLIPQPKDLQPGCVNQDYSPYFKTAHLNKPVAQIAP